MNNLTRLPGGRTLTNACFREITGSSGLLWLVSVIAKIKMTAISCQSKKSYKTFQAYSTEVHKKKFLAGQTLVP